MNHMASVTELAIDLLADGKVPTFGPRTAAPDDPTPIYDDLMCAADYPPLSYVWDESA